MKRSVLLAALLVCCCALLLTVTETTEAARLGGGRSFGGKPFMSTPAPARPQTAPSRPGPAVNQNRPQQQQPAAGAARPGLFGGMGGLMGGLLGLAISVGVSFNKVFAKLGSDYKKPDATTVISRENWRDIVWPLPVGDLLFVGRAARRTLGQYGVETIGQLAACKPEMLEQLMGKMGVQLYRYANGLDDAPVRPQHQREPVKSVGNSTTFPENLTRWEEIRSGLQLLSDSVAGRLRKEGLYCGGVAVAVKDAQFRTVSRQMRLGTPTHLMRDIFEAAQELTRRIWKTPTPVRLLSVTALYITDSADSYQQLDLLAGDAPLRDQRQEQLESAMDAIRGKYGRDAITFGRGGKVGWNKDE